MQQAEANLAVVQRLCEEWPKMTLDDFEDVLAPDCCYINIPHSEAPRIGPQAAFKPLSRYRDWRVDLEVLGIVASGDIVLTERMETFYKPGSSEGVKLPVMGAFKVQNGKITEWRDYFDSAHSAPLHE